MALKGWNTNATTPAGGRKERVNAMRRICSTNSCANVLDPGWPWKRCKQCSRGSQGREGRRATNPYMPVVSAAFVCPLYRVYCIFGFAHTGIGSARTTVTTAFFVLCGVSSREVHRERGLDCHQRSVPCPCPPEPLDRSRRRRVCGLHDIRVSAGFEKLAIISRDSQHEETKIPQFSVNVFRQLCSVCSIL